MRPTSMCSVAMVVLAAVLATPAWAGFVISDYTGFAEGEITISGDISDSAYETASLPEFEALAEAIDPGQSTGVGGGFGECRLLFEDDWHLHIGGYATAWVSGGASVTATGSGHLATTASFLLPLPTVTMDYVLDVSGVEGTLTGEITAEVMNQTQETTFLSVTTTTHEEQQLVVTGDVGDVITVTLDLTAAMDTGGIGYANAGGGADAQFDFTPEPTTLSLLALGGLALLGRRR
jgi:hypothetical protein